MDPITLTLLLVFTLVSVFAFTQQPEAPPPPTAEIMEIPSVEQGADIPVVFGTEEIKDTQVIDYYKKRQFPIIVKTGK